MSAAVLPRRGLVLRWARLLSCCGGALREIPAAARAVIRAAGAGAPDYVFPTPGGGLFPLPLFWAGGERR